MFRQEHYVIMFLVMALVELGCSFVVLVDEYWAYGVDIEKRCPCFAAGMADRLPNRTSQSIYTFPPPIFNPYDLKYMRRIEVSLVDKTYGLLVASCILRLSTS